MSKPVLIIDADVLCYQMAYSSTTRIDWDGDGQYVEALRPEQAKVKTESYVLSLVERFNAGNVILALTTRDAQYRKQLWPEYKANRSAKPRPELWYIVRDHIEQGRLNFPVMQYPRLEGDDVLGILGTGTYRDNCILVSIDKDMRTLPCRLFNPNHDELGVRTITPEAAHFFHMQQTIAGDTTDNYKGVPGMGMKTAYERLTDPRLLAFFDGKLWPIVVSCFQGKGMSEEDALLNARLAFILRDGDYNIHTHKVKLWTPQHKSVT